MWCNGDSDRESEREPEKGNANMFEVNKVFYYTRCDTNCQSFFSFSSSVYVYERAFDVGHTERVSDEGE